MPNHNFYKYAPIIGCEPMSTAVASGTACTTNFDLSGYDGAVCIVNLVTTATGNLLKAVGCTASGGVYSDIAGSQTTGQTTCLELEVFRPDFRFIKFQLVTQGTSSKYGPIYTFGIKPRSSTAANIAAVTTKFIAYPGSGTATSS